MIERHTCDAAVGTSLFHAPLLGAASAGALNTAPGAVWASEFPHGYVSRSFVCSEHGYGVKGGVASHMQPQQLLLTGHLQLQSMSGTPASISVCLSVKHIFYDVRWIICAYNHTIPLLSLGARWCAVYAGVLGVLCQQE